MRERGSALERRERESGGFRRGGIAPQENDGTEVAVCLSCGAACSLGARERAAGGPAQESAGQGSRKRARGRRRLAGLRSASAIAGFSPFEKGDFERLSAPIGAPPSFLVIQRATKIAAASVPELTRCVTLSKVLPGGGAEHTHTHTRTVEHTQHSTTHEGTWFSSFSYRGT